MKEDFSLVNRPQVELSDILYSVWCFLSAGLKGDSARKLEDSFKDLLQVDYVFFF